jgi:hypothetical protein
MGNPETLQNASQRKNEGGNVSSRVNDAEGNELLCSILKTLKRIELHLSMMTNNTLKEADYDDHK